MKKQKALSSVKSPTHSVNLKITSQVIGKSSAGTSINSSILQPSISFGFVSSRVSGINIKNETNSNDKNFKKKKRIPLEPNSTKSISPFHINEFNRQSILSNAKKPESKESLLSKALGQTLSNISTTQSKSIKVKMKTNTLHIKKQSSANNKNKKTQNLTNQIEEIDIDPLKMQNKQDLVFFTQENNNMKIDLQQIQITSPIHSSSSDESLLIKSSGAIGDEDHHLLPFSPKSAGGSPNPLPRHFKKQKSKFHEKLNDDEEILNHILLGQQYNDDESTSDQRNPYYQDTLSIRNSHNSPQRHCSDQNINRFQAEFSPNYQKNLNKKLLQLDKEIFVEKAKKSKIDKKLRVVDDENQKLRTMINYLLNADFY